LKIGPKCSDCSYQCPAGVIVHVLINTESYADWNEENMSKFMQIDIRLLPAYGSSGLKGSFPHLYEFLSNSGYDRVVANEPSLYEMVEVMIRIKNDPHVREESKKPIIGRLSELVKVRDQARELLLARRLNELDRLLYRLEDLFDELDGNLG